MINRLDEKEYQKYCDKYKLRFQYIEGINNLIILIPFAGYIPAYDNKFVDAVRNIVDNEYKYIVVSLLETPTTRIVMQCLGFEKLIEEKKGNIEIVIVTTNEYLIQNVNDEKFPLGRTKLNWFRSIESAIDFFKNKV